MASEFGLSPVDYFSPSDYVERYQKGYGLYEYLRMYNGGLGVLGGHLLNGFADLGFNVAAMSILYNQGFGRQEMKNGYQHWAKNQIDISKHFMKLFTETYHYGERPVEVDVYRTYVTSRSREDPCYGIPFYLIDVSKPCNPEIMRNFQLYQGDPATKLCQEIILGSIAMKVRGKIFGSTDQLVHTNDSLPAFAPFEMLYEQFNQGKGFLEALDFVKKHHVHTSHTPVAAAFHTYPYDLVENLLGGALDSRIGDVMHKFGRAVNNDVFSLGFLAMLTAGKISAVSQLNAEVAQHLDEFTHTLEYRAGYVHWDHEMPHLNPGEETIIPITNGVDHVNVVSKPFQKLYDKALGNWVDHPENARHADLLLNHGQVWEAHMKAKTEFFAYLNEMHGTHLDPHQLTIGFGRRFAEYKRADLIFSDPERFRRCAQKYLDATGKPMQFVWAGLGHPTDRDGLDLLHRVYELGYSWDSKKLIINEFMDDYRIFNAMMMIAGVDLWLNNPHPPEEASGTSGMKAGMNGVPSFSTLDGWFAEGYRMDNMAGWKIGVESKGYVDRTHLKADEIADARSLYDTLENEIIPAYVNTIINHTGTEWYERMVHAIKLCLSKFNIHETARNYATKFWPPSASHVLTPEEYMQQQRQGHIPVYNSIFLPGSS